MNNFLSIVWYRVLPAEYGGQKGIAGFNQCLGHKVPLTCLCSRNNSPGKDISYKMLNELPVSRFQFWNPLVRKHILSIIRKNNYSHIIIEHPWHAWLGKYKQKMGFRFIVHAHNIEHLRMKSRGKSWWPILKKTEQKAFAMADHILFKTEEDKTTALSLFDIDADKCLIVPYGIDETGPPAIVSEERERLRNKYNLLPGEKIILFAGTLDYEPNAEALDSILQYIVPLLQKKGFNFRLLICGTLPAARQTALNALPNITTTGFVDDLLTHLAVADVFINPVTSGSGIQTKNIEAIGAGCTIVTTAFASRGLPAYLTHKKAFISPDNDWESFAANIIRASDLTDNVPEQFYREYNWQNIINRLLPSVLPLNDSR